MEHQHSQNNKSGLSFAFWLNLIFSIVEIIGGILTNSTAIIADAFHDFMDAVAIGIAVLLEKLSGKKRTSKFSYGYKRFSLLSALGMSLFLLIGAGLMIVSAAKSIANPVEVHSVGMLWLAVLGIAVNGLAFLRIKNGRGNHHAHSHNHSHGDSNNHNSKAIMLHLLEDVLGWVAVLVGAIIIYFTSWYWIDGVLALAIGLFIGYNASRNLISTMKVLLQSVPENVDIEQLIKELKQINGIKSIHDLHVWSLDGSYNIGSLHAVINTTDQNSGSNIQAAIVQLLEKNHIQHSTVQMETTDTHCKLVNC